MMGDGQWNVVRPLTPQHFLYFLPDPHGHGSLRPIFSDRDGDLREGGAGGFRQKEAILLTMPGSSSTIAARVSSDKRVLSSIASARMCRAMSPSSSFSMRGSQAAAERFMPTTK